MITRSMTTTEDKQKSFKFLKQPEKIKSGSCVCYGSCGGCTVCGSCTSAVDRVLGVLHVRG